MSHLLWLRLMTRHTLWLMLLLHGLLMLQHPAAQMRMRPAGWKRMRMVTKIQRPRRCKRMRLCRSWSLLPCTGVRQSTFCSSTAGMFSLCLNLCWGDRLGFELCELQVAIRPVLSIGRHPCAQTKAEIALCISPELNNQSCRLYRSRWWQYCSDFCLCAHALMSSEEQKSAVMVFGLIFIEVSTKLMRTASVQGTVTGKNPGFRSL